MPTCPSNPSPAPCALAWLVAEARRWFTFTTERGLPMRYAAEKALGALALSARLALPLRPHGEHGDTQACDHRVSLALPTKLVGTSAFQPALRALRASRAPAGTPLRLAVDRGRIAVFVDERIVEGSGERLLGLVQPKHGWLTPLVAHGASAVLLRVTGDPARGHTLGVNVAFTGLGDAIRAFECMEDGRRGDAVRAGGPFARRHPRPTR